MLLVVLIILLGFGILTAVVEKRTLKLALKSVEVVDFEGQCLNFGFIERILRSRNYQEITEKLWGGHLWSPSYFAASCGGAPLDIIKRYIEDQRSA